MTGMVTQLWMAVLLGWLGFVAISFMTDTQMAAIAGLAFGISCVVMLRETVVLRGLVAVLEPVGVILPVLALRHVAGKLGVEITPLTTVELLVFLALYIAFLLTAFDVIPVEAYRLGYAPVPVAVMVLLACAYGAATGNLLVPLVAVVGQLLWVLGWGSSNWFDHVLHVLLVPVIFATLIGRLF
ncbi:hypothetical protein ROA7450_00970 [Roseovarius albus]|uniref:Uncharacterized protein n=2 Tax=Roseovarius albus TaxID=1247867 RepID=A0A1X6YMK7_9RHOB|nr:hypothetical protein ROA7450_00970 [Roseovarius albus]